MNKITINYRSIDGFEQTFETYLTLEQFHHLITNYEFEKVIKFSRIIKTPIDDIAYICNLFDCTKIISNTLNFTSIKTLPKVKKPYFRIKERW